MALISLVFVLFSLVSLADSKPRGVSISKASLYEPRDGKFVCFDGSDTIPFEEVNDDFCDCADGSDEPGTSACPNGWFHCTNAGYLPKTIPSSRVDDFLCDCCDGTDEPSSATSCPNNCMERGRELAAERARKRLLADTGYQQRKQWAERGTKAKQAKQVELKKLQEEREAVAGLRQEKQVQRDEIEAQERETKEEFDSERQGSTDRDAAERAFMELDTNHDNSIDVNEVQQHAEFDTDGDGEVSVDEAKGHLEDSSYVDLETFQDNIWSHARSVFKPKGGAGPSTKSSSDLDSDAYPDDIQKLIDDAAAAREDYRRIDDRFSDINNKIKSLKDYLLIDLGSDQAFNELYDKCFEYTDREYTYKLCMFRSSTQRPKNGGSETSLGNWGNWIEDGDKHGGMLYSNGQGCWQGPPRSTKVTLHCGVRNELTSASEPNRCEYAFDFYTPAVCPALPTPEKKHPAHTEL